MGTVTRLLLAFCMVSPVAWAGISAAAESVAPPMATQANPVPGANSGQVMGVSPPGEMTPRVPGPDYARPWWKWWACARVRLPHLAYPPPVPGSYYFRPYSVIGLRDNQADALLWGGDPRDPYSNDLFQRVYSEIGNGPSRPKE